MRSAIAVPLVAFGLLCVTSCTKDTQAINLDSSANGSTIYLSVGDSVEVELEGNPTTGYQWLEAKSDEAGGTYDLSIIYKSDANPTGMSGVGGTYSITINALAPGEASVKLEYRRDWENNDPAGTFALKLDISAEASSE